MSVTVRLPNPPATYSAADQAALRRALEDGILRASMAGGATGDIGPAGPDSIPVVDSSAARDVLYPTPALDDRVFNKETGETQRYDGAEWSVSHEPPLGFYHATSFGAVGDGVTNDTAAVQACLDAAAAVGGIAYFRAGSYKLFYPVYVPDGLEILGASRTLTSLTSGFYCGPMLFVGPPPYVGTPEFGAGYPGVRTTASVIGATAALDFRYENDTTIRDGVPGYDVGINERPFYYVSLDDGYHFMRLHGRSQLCVRFHHTMDATANGGTIICSSGARSDGEVVAVAFQVKAGESFVSLNHLYVQLQTTTHTINQPSASPVFVAGVKTCIEVHWDGARLRVFAETAGQPVGQEMVCVIDVACTGTIVQSEYETFAMMKETKFAWEFSQTDRYPCNGELESLFIGTTALKTATTAFAVPTTPYLRTDTGCLVVFNGETDGKACFIGRNAANDPCYFVVRNTVQFSLKDPIVLRDMSVDGGGQCMPLFETCSNGCFFYRVNWRNGSPDAAHRYSENFGTKHWDCDFFTGERHSWFNANNSGFAPMVGNRVFGGKFGLVEVGGASLQHYGLISYPTPERIFCVHSAIGNGGGMYGCNIDFEVDPVPTDYGGTIFMAQQRNYSFYGGGFIAADRPSFTFGEGCLSISIHTPELSILASECLHFLNPDAQEHPIELFNPQQGPTGASEPPIPWSLNPELVAVHINGVVLQGMKNLGNSGTAKTLVAYPSHKQKITMTGNCTFTVTLEDGERIQLHTLTGAGGFTGTFTGVTWVLATPTLTAGAGKRDIFELWKTDSVLFGCIVGQNI